MTMFNRSLLVAGWLLRASALLCIAWLATQVVSGTVTTLPAILSSVAFHAAFAVGGTTLVGIARHRAPATALTVTAPTA